MKIKVCGMRQPENIAAVASLNIDLMGFIFFAKSPRYVADTLAPTPDHIGRVGVFVDECFETIIRIARLHNLTHVQLHGNESPERCVELKKRGYTIIKAFQISNYESFAQCHDYEQAADMLLFDTASQGYGGSGRKFDWSCLAAYTGKLPYILSGGVSADDMENIMQITDPRLWGVDLNSRFEQAPALKNIDQLNQFIAQLRNGSQHPTPPQTDEQQHQR